MTNEMGGEPQYPLDLSESSIRKQLLWAAFFPVAFFSLLSILAISSALNRTTFVQASRHSTAQAQWVAASMLDLYSNPENSSPIGLEDILKTHTSAGGSQWFALVEDGRLVVSYPSDDKKYSLIIEDLQVQARSKDQDSLLIQVEGEETLVSFTTLPGRPELKVFVAEPWSSVSSQAVNFQVILAVLLLLGSLLSLGMLSFAISRVIQPISLLVEIAGKAVPGSMFHPIGEHGPAEIRTLIRAFNQMVIRLAEQQTTLRQYAHKALLSQEEERQRLSHELHDGTLQDLVGLAQRVELCRNELERDPLLARQRLDELHQLLGKAIDDMRRISSALRPPVLEDFGLPVALDALSKDLMQEKPGLHCEYRLSGNARRLSPDLELAVYRVVQEAMANIRKHAQNARLIQIELTFGEQEVEAVIKNDGVKFTPGDVRSFVKSGHLGLAGMYERARLFGGSLNINVDHEENTVVSLKLPYA